MQPSPSTRRKGIHGENLAVEYLVSQGFEILERNWRYGRYELDVIARREKILHIVEVKTRKTNALTSPEEAMTPSKFNFLCKAAERYIVESQSELEVQFDLIAIDLNENGTYALRYLPEIMVPHW